ncbi:hypothetical protein VTK26DRAFT_3233 [Humicola hyalothermophila]
MNSEPPSQVQVTEVSSTAVEEPVGNPATTPPTAQHIPAAAGPDPRGGPLELGAAKRADTDLSWGAPAGLPIRRFNDENLVIFRRAVGINSTLSGSTDPESLEAGRRKAVGIYGAVIRSERRKTFMYHAMSLFITACHFAQIIVAASLTALGPSAGQHVLAITLLGALNTIIAGVLALIKGQGLPDRLYHDRAEYRKLQDWIEQTEALLSVGVIGRNRKEVGLLVQTAFKKYNAAKECEENNIPEIYARPAESEQQHGGRSRSKSPNDRTRTPSRDC